MRESMNVPPWKMPWLSDGSVVLGCGMAFSLVNTKWEGDRYARKSCEDNYHAGFFWNGDKGGSKTKGWGTNPCRSVWEALQQ